MVATFALIFNNPVALLGELLLFFVWFGQKVDEGK
jgi:hypothetical protein